MRDLPRSRRKESSMDLSTVKEFINGVGFPIAACVILFFQNGKLQKTLTDISVTMQSLTERITNMEDRIGGN